MTRLSSLFLFWITILALFVSLTSLTTQTALPGQIFQILFLPVTVYLIYAIVNHLSTGTPAFDFQSGWKRLVIYYCFIVSVTLVTASFLSARTIPQIISSFIFSPLAIYFLWLTLPHRSQALLLPQFSKVQHTPTPTSKTNLDADRRDFLKLIGTAGISIFLYNLLFRRNTAPLFNSAPTDAGPLALKNTQGNVINPAEKSPTEGYYISQIDDSIISYFGFINNLGQWFIMRQDVDNAYRYSRGDKDFTTNWAGRAKLSYDYFDNVF